MTPATLPGRLMKPDTTIDSNAAALWTAFLERGDEEARATIISQQLPLVHHVARGIHHRVGEHVILDDLVNAGCVGLIDAVDTFDATRGVAFSTHAVPRIRGSIIDELRRGDIASRSVRRHQRMIAEAEQQLTADLARRPLETETAERLDIDTETLLRWKADVRDVTRISLNGRVRVADGEGRETGDLIAGSTGLEVEDRLTVQQETEVLETEIPRLPERERIVLMLYYHEGLKLREIAEVLGVTESRISQIRTQALRTLRCRMSRLRPESGPGGAD